jgi:predicted HicB family RNase H-like nuclease
MPRRASGKPNADGRVTQTIRLRPDLWKRLVEAAARNGVSATDLVSRILDAYVDGYNLVGRFTPPSAKARRKIER